MKKLLVFLLAFVVALSVLVVSSASTSKYDENIKPYLGMWYQHRQNANGYTIDEVLAIGFWNPAQQYTVKYIETLDNPDVGKYTIFNEYSMTYDKSGKQYYLIDAEGEIKQTLKIENGKLLFSIFGSEKYDTFERVK